MRGLLEGDLTLVEQAREHIVEEIYQSLGEGLQYDNSFHQHGEQMQFGNYGLSYINSLVYWARVLRATPLAIDHERIAMLGDYITDGIQWTVWRGVMDPNAAARQVFDNSQRGKGYSLALSVGNMREADAENVETYDKYLKRNLLDISSENTLLGVNYFWHSDYFIARRDSWYASVRMNSDRILGFEMTNRENLQGVYSADGVLMVLVDGDEYHNIYPLWNWKRLPGLTCFDDGEPIPFNSPKEPINRSGFVGGVTSDSGDGIAVMHLLTDDIELRKGSFFLDDVIVALGSDINVNNSHPLTTTLDQRLLRTDAPITLGDGEKSWSFEGEKEERELSWLHHDKVGYILPESPLVEISRESRREPWSRIADAYSPDRVGEGVVFTASIKHSSPIKGGGYSYIVLPDSDAAQVAAFAANPSIEIVSNSSALQAISANGGSTLAAIFYEPTTLKCGRYSITPSAAVVLLLEHDEQGVKLTIADPTQRLDGVTLELEIDEKSEKIDIQLPTQQGYRGSCVSINID